jgi:AcrR family transcriptional regulator
VRRTQEERSAETRGKLLDATIDSLIDLGYSATTTTVIAERAGLSRGAQLHHFPTKAELVSAAVEHLTRKIGEDLQKDVERLPENGDRVSAAVDLLWSRFSTPLFPAWLELLVASRTDADLARCLTAVGAGLERAAQRQAFALFGEAAGKSPNFELAMELTFDVLYGMALERALDPTDGKQRKRRETAKLAAWKGLVVTLLEQVA